MRMRKKRNFDARMEACGDLLLAHGANGILNMKEAAENYRDLLDFDSIFGAGTPVSLEIGCGKGDFAVGMSAKHQDLNFIAMERVADVACLALEKAMAASDTRADNLRFIIAYSRIRLQRYNKKLLKLVILSKKITFFRQNIANRS